MKLLYVFVLAMLFCFNVQADVGFEAGVNVEAQAQNSAQAKQDALKKAYREAFLKVCNRLTSAKNVDDINRLTDSQLLHFIQEVEVVAEKTTSNSYMADLNIKINANLLKQYLAENNMLGSDEVSEKILIIPTYSDTDFNDKVLFEDGNVWRSSWLDKGQIVSGQFNFEIIKNNPQNVSALNSQAPDSIDTNVYNKLKFNNVVDNIFIVNAIRAGAKTLVIGLKTYPKSYHKSFVINDDNAFDKAIEQTVAHITNFMQNKISSVNDNSGDIVVTADVNLKGWLEIEKKLNHIAQIKATGIKSAKVGKIGFWVKYSGSISELIENMAQNGLYLQINDNQYTLSI
ncbi:MAG: hypothetical protein E7016_01070 [Alphaproteobacteria bacterium]|nr:hypothetical protein [Alphaproteobacteria bacterium]